MILDKASAGDNIIVTLTNINTGIKSVTESNRPPTVRERVVVVKKPVEARMSKSTHSSLVEAVNPQGRVRLTLTDVITGKVKAQRVCNLVVTNGKQWIARRFLGSQIAGGSPTVMKYMELGRGSAAATGSNVQLQTTVNVSGIRQLGNTVSVSGQTFTVIANWGTSNGNTSNLKEIILAGTSTRASVAAPGILARAVFSAINKTNVDTLKIEWDIRVI